MQFYLIDWRHKHTRTPKNRWLQPLVRPPALRERRAEDQSLHSDLSTSCGLRAGGVAGLRPFACEANATTTRVRRTRSPLVSPVSLSFFTDRDTARNPCGSCGGRKDLLSSLVVRSRRTLIHPVPEEGTPPLSLIGRFWRAESLVALSLAKTSGKSVDWPGGVVTSRGPPFSPSRGLIG